MGRAGAENLHERKPLLVQRLLDQLLHLPAVVRRLPGHIIGARDLRKRADVEVALRVSPGGGAGKSAARRRGGDLPPGHAVIEVVDDDGRQIDIPSRGMNEVVPADGHRVPVPHQDHHMQLRVEGLDARRIGQRAAVRRVKGMGHQVVIRLPGAADPRHDDGIAVFVAQFLECPQHGPQHDTDPAAGAPHVRQHPLFQIGNACCV